MSDLKSNYQKMNIKKIIQLSKENNPAAIKPIFSTLMYEKISNLLEVRKEEIKKEI
jgi:hypothetical protein